MGATVTPCAFASSSFIAAGTAAIQPGPRLGMTAPDFTLRTLDGKEEITLSQFRGKKPVVLIFGSFT